MNGLEGFAKGGVGPDRNARSGPTLCLEPPPPVRLSPTVVALADWFGPQTTKAVTVSAETSAAPTDDGPFDSVPGPPQPGPPQPNPPQTDLDLAAALLGAQAGDEASFTRMYRLVQPGLLRYLRVLIASDAEDVASETWANVCRDLHQFEGDADGFRGWVATIGRHRALDQIRSRNRHPADAVPTEAMEGLVSLADTERQAIESVSTAGAVALIASLPPDQAEAVMLRAVLGLDAKTAAAVLGKRPGAVRTSAHRGLKSLAARLTSAPSGGST
ncbi:MAG: putative polymerase ECF-subfamily sigma factor [Pseudonocardiales bacterium]|nr:putative polymerase ECF-subfamily sigma factor [Pseudonocardiales bacterium]